MTVPVLFGTAGSGGTRHHLGMRALRFIGDGLGGVVIALGIPVVILAVGVPVALVGRLALWSLGLL